MKKLLSIINSILAKKTKLNPNESWISGLSGGQDSVLLFIILVHIKKQWNIQIKIVHFHHFWQQKNFFYTQQVWQLSFLFKNSLYIFVSESSLKNEKKARNWRKNGFERVSSIENSKKILLGHTATDRIETAFWHLIRGTSSQGLGSLKLQTTTGVKVQFFHFPTFFILEKNFFINSKNGDFSNKQFSKKYTSFQKKRFLISSFPFQKVPLFGRSSAFYSKKWNFLETKGNEKKGKKNNLKNKKKLKTSFNSSRNKNKLKYDFRKKNPNDLIFCSVNKEKKRKNLDIFQPKNQTNKVFLNKKNFFYQMHSISKKSTFHPAEILSFLVFKHSSSPQIFFEKNLPLFLEQKHLSSLDEWKASSIEQWRMSSFSTFVLFNLFFSEKILVRPLLYIHRNDVAFFIKKYKLPLISDPTNEKLCWSRNRLRYQLFPLIKIFLNPNTEYLLTNYLEITNEEQKYIEFLISKISQCFVKNEQNNEINTKSSNALENLLHFFPIAIQRRLLQKIFQSYTGLQPKYYQIQILKNSIK